MDSGQIILFQTQGGETKIEVRLANESVWLTADQMAELFQRDRSTIQRHIKRIYGEGELMPDSTCALFAQVQTEGKRQVERQIPIYNLDMIISVGYRVNSHRGVQFR
ncbi:virulence RhuM family protein, partial [Bacteroides acidifaciens]